MGILEPSQLLLQHAALIQSKSPYNQSLDPNSRVISHHCYSLPGAEIRHCWERFGIPLIGGFINSCEYLPAQSNTSEAHPCPSPWQLLQQP